MPLVIITGAGRGLGLEFARQYLADGWDVVATVRSPTPELDALGVDVRTLDAGNVDDGIAFAEAFERPLDLLIANAGTANPSEAKTAHDAAAWLDMFRVNVVAPAILARALMPRLTEGKGKAIAISSKMGSIADASTGWIPYRASKSALNMAWHALANEFRDSLVAMATLHPGWVQTDMGGPNATIDPPTSIAGMREVIAGLTIARSGSFINYDGTSIPW